MILQEYHYEIRYRKGKINGNADSLSRLVAVEDSQVTRITLVARSGSARINDPWEDELLIKVLRKGRLSAD